MHDICPVYGFTKDYIRSNLGVFPFTNIKINLMLFINSSGHMIYGKAFDLEKGEEIPVPLQLQKLSVHDILLNHTPYLQVREKDRYVELS